MKTQIHLHMAIGLTILGLVVWGMTCGTRMLALQGDADRRAWQEQHYQDCMAKINDNRACYQDTYARP